MSKITLSQIDQAVQSMVNNGLNPKLATVAFRFSVSERTLQRVMNSSKRTYKSIVDHYRFIRVLKLMIENIPVSELHQHVGMSDPSSFYVWFSNVSESTHLNDGLKLLDARITNAVKCAPPQNKPTTTEVKTCNQYLQQELKELSSNAVVLALGRIAHESILRALSIPLKEYPFAHAAIHEIPDHFTLIDSYHCSRYNTQTRRLTVEQFEDVFATIKTRLNR